MDHAAELGRIRRQRCEATLRGEATDRAPAYLTAMACGVASQLLGRPAVTGTGSVRYAEVAAWADGEAAHAEFEERLLADLADLQRLLDIEFMRMPWRMNERPDARLDEFTFRFGPEDGEHSIWQYHPATADFSAVRQVRLISPEERLRNEVIAMEKIAADPMPAARAAIASAVDLHRRFGREFYVCSAGAGIGVGFEPDELETLVTAPGWVKTKTLLQAEFAIAIGRAVLEAGLPPVMAGGGDLAGTAGPIYSPAMFRALVLPAYVRAVGELNRMGIHYYFRSDGNLGPLLDMLFGEAACPGYGETDRDAAMTVAAVRAKFPRVVIYGNVSSQLLMHGSVEEVRQQARATIEEAGHRGYFQGCSNAVVLGTSPEKVRVMYGER
ncbi:MAG TPA: uroporphyrinogen decarboxylase family protein [Opitutaceae bacterium]|nr:uroporphyrinogen decarboxylase family protein [Opitutaceae bacterium]HND60879.1 uroporphyrinogen decarboxylase family protein [Opitutaceae bacterium]